MMDKSALIAKYDIPAPRYTSYPTVPYWSVDPSAEQWLDHIRNSLQPSSAKIAIYIHIPFCESLCTFCGCNKSITKNHSVEDPYIENLLKEFNIYLDAVPELKTRELKEIHLGGGSPTYLSEKNLEYMVTRILEKMNVSSEPNFSVEVEPRRTRREQLEVLYKLGFKRVSLGVQDFDEEVQRLINRNQPLEKTKAITDISREIGYNSVNFDLIYGLPKQSLETMTDTIQKTLQLKPDRLAFYSYAHVPWIKPSQRLFTEDDLPRSGEKRKLYEYGRTQFENGGYKEIGMDHFALTTDSLWTSYTNGSLHRNFMGYTENRTDLQLGLGVSSISDSWTCFHQNEKILKKYEKRLANNQLPTLRGHILNEEDLMIRKLVLKLVTTWEVELPYDLANNVRDYLKTMEEDELIQWNGNKLIINEKGHPFLRNICMGLDLRMRNKLPDARVFSQSI